MAREYTLPPIKRMIKIIEENYTVKKDPPKAEKKVTPKTTTKKSTPKKSYFKKGK